MRREPLDAPENLPKDAARQAAFGRLKGEVPGMPDEASTRLEQPLRSPARQSAASGA